MSRYRHVLVDTGPLVAMRNKRDQHRNRILELAPSLPPVLYTTWPVITEVTYLLRSEPKEVAAILNSIGNELRLLPQNDDEAWQMAAVIEKYQDQGFSTADASLMVASSGGEFEAVFTVDRKDFDVWIAGEGLSLEIID